MSFGEKYGNIERVKLERFMQEARQAPFVRIDVSKCPAPDAETARTLFACLAQIDRLGKPVELIGALASRCDWRLPIKAAASTKPAGCCGCPPCA